MSRQGRHGAQGGKLVRDGIPDLIRARREDPVTRVLSADEFVAALRAKLEEEVKELLEASADHVVEEMADVLEVLRAMAAEADIAWTAVESAVATKRAARGGFDNRVWLEST